ncbi:MAG TPA: DUF1097 family protein [Deltaproteobacteria bacterium]|mgnify:CR=1 FL=1|jgi:hypothetical protein|nr:DUF1097 family protein [Deltaproteobacteria bacterium]HOI06664.1 DUF1097 family protein [Deltaproteobacteria bacterium]
MNKVLSARNVLFGFLLVGFIIVFELVFSHFDLPPWPAFMVMVFFFVAHENASLAPNILIGGLAGIACAVLVKEFIHLFGPYLGDEAAKLTFIGLFVYAIVLLKDAIPYVFNSYAFMFFLVAALAGKVGNQNPYIWMGVELVFGAIFIAGVLGITRIVDKMLGAKENA